MGIAVDSQSQFRSSFDNPMNNHIHHPHQVIDSYELVDKTSINS
jgi:hypothetical protein